MSRVWSKMITWVFFGLSSGALMGQNLVIQPKTNSPYSRFGLGDPVEQYFASQGGMAGLSTAFRDPFHLNLRNPASLASLQATAFEVGFNGKYSRLQGNNGASAGIWSGNLSYLALGFPLRNPINDALDRKRLPFGLGMSFALVPYTTVGYNLVTTLEDPNSGTATNILKGTGGTYRFLWGNAIRYKSLAAGLNLGYQFGKISNSRRVTFDSLSRPFNSEFLDEISYSGLVWEVGVQYTYTFKKPNAQGVVEPTGRRIVVGFNGHTARSFNTNSSFLYHRDNLELDRFQLDTIAFGNEVRGKGTLPGEFSLGVLYEHLNRFRIGAELSRANWSRYENEAKKESLSDTWRIALGGEIIPDVISYNNYFRRVRYRAGLFYGTDPRSIDGNQLKNYGITLGLGLPIILPRQQASFVNMALEAGRFGLPEGLRETYIKMTVGFTLNDNTWFFKRKFN